MERGNVADAQVDCDRPGPGIERPTQRRCLLPRSEPNGKALGVDHERPRQVWIAQVEPRIIQPDFVQRPAC